jgi:hypothetical protein|tara:strand:- start:71 stop:814 length:744 start_codon:yes stop_codon:yes gene_type:complete
MSNASKLMMAAAGQGGAATDENTVLLIRSDTTDGSTTFEDLSSYGHTILQPRGTVDHQTEQFKMGASSFLMDSSSDGLVVSASSAFNFGTGDFTIECWLRPTATASNDWMFELYNFAGNFAAGQNISVLYENSTRAKANIANRYNTHVFIFTNWLTVNTWSHVALVRYGNYVNLYHNGVAASNIYNATGVDFFSSGDPYIVIGNRTNTTLEWPYNNVLPGYYDEFKVSNIARYTGNFTPSSNFDYIP